MVDTTALLARALGTPIPEADSASTQNTSSDNEAMLRRPPTDMTPLNPLTNGRTPRPAATPADAPDARGRLHSLGESPPPASISPDRQPNGSDGRQPAAYRGEMGVSVAILASSRSRWRVALALAHREAFSGYGRSRAYTTRGRPLRSLRTSMPSKRSTSTNSEMTSTTFVSGISTANMPLGSRNTGAPGMMRS